MSLSLCIIFAGTYVWNFVAWNGNLYECREMFHQDLGANTDVLGPGPGADGRRRADAGAPGQIDSEAGV